MPTRHPTPGKNNSYIQANTLHNQGKTLYTFLGVDQLHRVISPVIFDRAKRPVALESIAGPQSPPLGLINLDQAAALQVSPFALISWAQTRSRATQATKDQPKPPAYFFADTLRIFRHLRMILEPQQYAPILANAVTMAQQAGLIHLNDITFQDAHNLTEKAARNSSWSTAAGKTRFNELLVFFLHALDQERAKPYTYKGWVETTPPS